MIVKKKAQTINLFKSTPSLQFMESMNIIKEYFKGYALWEVCFTEVPLEWDVLQRLLIVFYCSFSWSNFFFVLRKLCLCNLPLSVSYIHVQTSSSTLLSKS